MDIRLISLELKNYKGKDEFLLNLNGKNASVYGQNATGKSTLFDSCQWVLFGKDSFGRTDYQIKPQDENGNERHNLDTIVEGVFSVGGKLKKLKRQFSEKWVKKQGTQTKEFSGNETKYWIDDVPVKAKDYATEINILVRESVFKMLTNPLYFNTDGKGWSWQERRKILFEICGGNITDADAIDSLITVADKSMTDLLNVINSGRTIEQHKLVIAEKIKNTKKDMDGIPARISEQQRSITEDNVDYATIETSIEDQKAILQDIEAEIATSANAASLYRQKQQQAYKLQGEIDTRKKELEDKATSGLRKSIDEKAKLESDTYSLKSLITLDKSRIENYKEQAKIVEENLVALRKKFGEVQSQVYVAPDPSSFNCPTCGQGLPSDNISAKLNELRANFDSTLKSDLAKIQTEGKEQAKLKERYQDELTQAGKSITENEEKLNLTNQRIAELEKEIEANGKIAAIANPEGDEKLSSLNNELQTLKTELEKPIEDMASLLLYQKKDVMEQIEALNKTLNQKETVEKAKKRIEELKVEESKLAQELSEHERQDYLIKRFMAAKTKMLEDSINKKFTAVQFKLFDTLVYGTEKEVCRTMVNTNGVWVEWDGANNAGKINAGLDIIRILSNHYKVTLPLFVDNAESVNKLVDLDCQVIKLIVSEDERLKVEVG